MAGEPRFFTDARRPAYGLSRKLHLPFGNKACVILYAIIDGARIAGASRTAFTIKPFPEFVKRASPNL